MPSAVPTSPSARRRLAPLALLLAAALVGPPLQAQQQPPQQAAAVPAKPAKVVALVSLVGNEFSYVEQKFQTGSHLSPYHRRSARVEGQALNFAVLRGLDNALRQVEPNAKTVLLAMPAPTLDPDLRGAAKDRALRERLLAALERTPERMQWDEIIAVTPRYQFAGFDGMGDKLAGIGVYVQPIPSARFSDLGDGFDTLGAPAEAEAMDPNEREAVRSSTYVAPFMYMQLTVYDARTLKVLRTEDRLEHQKLYDPKSTALSVRNMFSADDLAGFIETFVERTARRAVAGDRPGSGRVDSPAPRRVQ